MREEFAICIYHHRPVNTMHILVIKPGSLFNSNIIEHGFALGGCIDNLGGIGIYCRKFI